MYEDSFRPEQSFEESLFNSGRLHFDPRESITHIEKQHRKIPPWILHMPESMQKKVHMYDLVQAEDRVVSRHIVWQRSFSEKIPDGWVFLQEIQRDLTNARNANVVLSNTLMVAAIVHPEVVLPYTISFAQKLRPHQLSLVLAQLPEQKDIVLFNQEQLGVHREDLKIGLAQSETISTEYQDIVHAGLDIIHYFGK